MKPGGFRLLCGLITVLLAAGLGFALISVYRSRSEAKRWRDTQRAGGVPRFWESQERIDTTLMNPPAARFVVTEDSGGKAVKRTESHGFAADDEVAIATAAGHRIFCVGDSVTYGLLPNSQSFPALLEALLEPSPGAWRVVNAGKGGESTYTALLRYRHVVSRYDLAGLVVGWFAGNEPVEMTREGVYTGPRARKVAGGWSLLWEDDTPLQFITDADVDRYLPAIEARFRAGSRPVREKGPDPMAYLKTNGGAGGVLSRRYALYGGTSFVSAFRFLRHQPDAAHEAHGNLQAFVARTLAVVRTFKSSLGDRLLYVVIPEAFEVDPEFVRRHPDYPGLLAALELSEESLSTAGDVRRWFMDLLEHEGVAYVDPVGEMKNANETARVFRPADLHPTLQGNLAIARAIARRSDFFRRISEAPGGNLTPKASPR